MNTTENLAKESLYFEQVLALNNLESALNLVEQNLPNYARILCSIYTHPLVVKCFEKKEIEFCDVEKDGLNIDCQKLESLFERKKIDVLILGIFSEKNLAKICQICTDFGVKIILISNLILTPPRINTEIKNSVLLCSIFTFGLGVYAPFLSGVLLATNNKKLANFITQKREFLSRQNEFYSVNLEHEKGAGIPSKIELNFISDLLKNLNAKKEILRTKKIKLSNALSNIKDIKFVDSSLESLILMIGKNRDFLAQKLRADSIACQMLFVPINFLANYKVKFGLKAGEFPNALKAYQEVLVLKVDENLDENLINFIAKKMAEHLDEITGKNHE